LIVNNEQSIEASGLKIIPFSEVSVLPAGASFQTHMNIAFTSASQAVRLEVVTDRGTYSVSVKPQLGELLRPITLSEADFDSRQSTQLANHPAGPPSPT
jgi:hypothetical protein